MYTKEHKYYIRSKEYIIEGAVHGYDADFPVTYIPTSEIPNFFKCKFEFNKDGSVVEKITGAEIKFKSNDDLKNKYKITRDFTFKDIKGCFEKKGLQMGSQGFAVKKNQRFIIRNFKREFLILVK